jgi:hypothetical protein
VPVDADLPLSARLAWSASFALEHLSAPGSAAALRLQRGRRELLEGLADGLAPRQARRLAVDEGTGLSPAEFRSRYMDGLRPYLFRGAAKDWRCVREWSVRRFGERFGADRVRLMDDDDFRRGTTGEGGELTLAEFAARVAAGGKEYIRCAPLEAGHPDLREALDLPWLERHCGPEHAGPLQFFMGGQGTRTPLHAEFCGNVMVQVQGRKRWLLYEPGTLLFLDPAARRLPYFYSDADPYAPEKAAAPLFARADRWEATVEAGDVLWVPPFWWHDVTNLSAASIGVRCDTSSARQALRASPLLFAMKRFARAPDVRVERLRPGREAAREAARAG